MLIFFRGYILLLAVITVSALLFLGVDTAGIYIPSDNITDDYFVAWIWAIILSVSIFLWPVPGKHKLVLLECWLAKVFVVLGLMLFYEHTYSFLDSYSYYWLSKTEFKLSDLAFGDGTENIYALTRLHRIFLFDSYHAMKLTWAMIGLVAIYIFYRAAIAFLGYDKIVILYIIALYPSILFWSSILGKDPVNLLGISLYVYAIIKWDKEQNLRSLLIGLAGIILASFIRSWYVLILTVPLVIIFLYQKNISVFLKIIFIILSSVAVVFSAWHFSEIFSLETTQDVVETTDKVSKGWAEGGSAQEVKKISSISDILIFAPLGIFTALFRPLIGEMFTPFGIFSGLENTILLGFFLLAVKNIRIKYIKRPIILWAISFIIIWSTIYGFVSSQNLGTAIRFRLQILPILLLFILYLLEQRKSHLSNYPRKPMV